MDADSSNLNAAWNDGTFPRFYLDTLHALSGRPVIVSEFYMVAEQNRSGDQNDSSDFPTVTTQEERAAGFRNTAEALARLPYVVGADWFQYYDEPTHGRRDGENYNFGLVDIHDQPYEPLTAAALGAGSDGDQRRAAPARLGCIVRSAASTTNPLDHFTIWLRPQAIGIANVDL